MKNSGQSLLGRKSKVNVHPAIAAYYERRLDLLNQHIDQRPGILTGEEIIDTPLCHLATRDGRVDVLNLINKIDIKHLEHLDAKGHNALQLSVICNQYTCTKFLLKTGAFDINVKYNDGQTLLHLACTTEDSRFIKILLDNGANANAEDNKGNLPLHRACQEDNLEMAELLILHTTNINSRGEGKRTALHFAALSQSLKLIILLLKHNALLRMYDDEMKGPMDVVLSLGNFNLLAGLSDFFCRVVTGKVYSIDELQKIPSFGHVLTILDAIDDDMENPTVTTKNKARQCDTLTDQQKRKLVKKICSQEKMDYIEFAQCINMVCIHELSDLILKEKSFEFLALKVVAYILFREDHELLKVLMFQTKLWQRLVAELEKKIVFMYQECNELGSTGMVNMLHKNTFENGKINFDLMAKFFANFANLTNISTNLDNTCPFMRNPMLSLALWSVMTGRFNLTEDLLKGDQFDMLPLGLFCIALLRILQKNRAIPRPTIKVMENVADKVESVCLLVLRKIYMMDTTEKKMISIHFLRQPLSVYGNRSIMELASAGQSESFMVSNSVQAAVDREWYGQLFHVNYLYRELLIFLGILPFNPLVYFLVRKVQNEYSFVENLGIDADSPPITFFPGTVPGGDVEMTETKVNELTFITEETETTTAAKEVEQILIDGTDKEESVLSAYGDDKPDEVDLEKTERVKSKGFIHTFFSVMIQFYTTPNVKFHYHILAHITFIFLFSYILIVNLDYKLSIDEVFIYLFLAGFLIEEFQELISSIHKGEGLLYFQNGWNMLDWIALTFGLIGFGMRLERTNPRYKWEFGFSEFDDVYFWWTRFVLTICNLCFWLRLLYISTVMKNLGPKLKMISVMITRDFLPFIFLLSILMMGFAQLMHSMLFPNGYSMNNNATKSAVSIVQRMFKITFYSMMGDFSTNLLNGQNCEDNLKCPHETGRLVVQHIVMVIYVLIATVLLINLIVASFSKTVDEISKKSFAMWQFERYDLLNEFQVRSPLPPPLNILGELFSFLNFAFRSCCKKPLKSKGNALKKQWIIKFLSLQAFSLRGHRRTLVGELEILDPDKFFPEMKRKLLVITKNILKLSKEIEDNPTN